MPTENEPHRRDGCTAILPTPTLASNDNRANAMALDQYYTDPKVARFCYGLFILTSSRWQTRLIEPSAGTGAFFSKMPAGSLAYDIDPKFPGIITQDFLTVEPISEPCSILGNPPFGKNSSMAVRFFNHSAAIGADTIAMIFPRTFRKASIVNRLDRAFHLEREFEMPADSFLVEGQPYNVPAVFQVWERREVPRPLWPTETAHPDFDFTTPGKATFAVQRVGARAGRVHHDFGRSPSSHYFISGNVEAVMRKLDFRSVALDTAGNPSISKAEIVALYREYMALREVAA